MDKPWLKFYDASVPPGIQYPDRPLQNILEEAADQFPERTGVFFFGGKMKYRELRNEADRFAAALRSTGFRKGDRLGIILPNMPQAIISFFGALKAGGVGVFLDPKGEKEELQRQLNDAGVETAVVLDLLLPRIDPIFPGTNLKRFIITGVKDYLPFPRNIFFSLAAKGRGIEVKVAKKPNIHLWPEFLLKGQEAAPGGEENETGPDEPAAILYTSGTSGPPKGTLLSHRNLTANLLQTSAWLGNLQRGREIFLSVLPFHQAFGVAMALNMPIYLAATAVHQPHFEITQILSLIKKIQPTFFPVSPSMVESLSNYPYDLSKHRIPQVKVFWSTAGPLAGEIMQNLERRIGRKVCEAYGLTETSPFTHANPLAGKRKAGSIGIPLPDTEAKIVETEKGEKELPPGEPGELVVRGPQVMKGYWNRPEETKGTLRQGWLHTGDLARMDEEGFFYILGKIQRNS